MIKNPAFLTFLTLCGLSGYALAQTTDRDASFMPPVVITAPTPAAPAPVSTPAPSPVAATPLAAPAPTLASPDVAKSPPAMGNNNTANTGSSVAPVVTPVVVTSPAPAPITQTTPVTPQPQPTGAVDLVGTQVVASPLQAINPESVGLIGIKEGGFTTGLWDGAPFEAVQRLLPTLNLPTTSPTLNNLAARMLTTIASVPTITGNGGMSFLSKRIDRLITLGKTDEAWALAANAKPELVDDVTLHQLLEISLLGAHADAACSKVAEIIKTKQGTDWQALFLICQLRADDTKAAQLTLDLMRGADFKDTNLLSLAEKNVIGGSKQFPRQLTPLKAPYLALLLLSKQTLPSEVFARPAPALIPALIQAQTASDDQRLTLGERALLQGALTAADIGALYRAVPFAPEMLAAPTPPAGLTDTKLRAFLYQAALADKNPVNRINGTLRMAQGMDGITQKALAPLMAEMVAGIVPITDYAIVAPQVTRIFMLADKQDAAKDWLALAERAAIGMPQATVEVHAMWPLLALNHLVSDADMPAKMKAWVSENLDPAQHPDARAARELTAKTLLVLQATGIKVTDDMWASLLDTPSFEKRQRAFPLVAERLRLAAINNRVGEAIIESILLASNPQGTDWTDMLEIVRSLNALGLKHDATALATEMMLQMPPQPTAKP